MSPCHASLKAASRDRTTYNVHEYEFLVTSSEEI